MNIEEAKKAVISAYFEADHARLDTLFRSYQSLKRSDFPRAKNCFRDFLRGLQRHIVWEEEVLFPFFEQRSGMPPDAGPTAVHDKVRMKNPDSDAEEAALIQVLSSHNFKEENILYPAIDQASSDADAADLFHAMESIPPERYATGCCGSHSH